MPLCGSGSTRRRGCAQKSQESAASSERADWESSCETARCPPPPRHLLQTQLHVMESHPATALLHLDEASFALDCQTLRLTNPFQGLLLWRRAWVLFQCVFTCMYAQIGLVPVRLVLAVQRWALGTQMAVEEPSMVSIAFSSSSKYRMCCGVGGVQGDTLRSAGKKSCQNKV